MSNKKKNKAKPVDDSSEYGTQKPWVKVVGFVFIGAIVVSLVMSMGQMPVMGI